MWARVHALVRAHPRTATGVGFGGVAATTAAVAVLLASDGPPKVHFPPRPKLEALVFSYPPNALPEGSPRAVVPTAPTTYSGVQSAGLELVRSEKGRLSESFAQQGACARKPCNARIVVKADGAVAFDGDKWGEGYIPTGRGEEVVRVKRRPKV